MDGWTQMEERFQLGAKVTGKASADRENDEIMGVVSGIKSLQKYEGYSTDTVQ
jgi:hypothetical protein